ncbi:hypothetical protein NM688_g2178 [Phlebia brevispora]|uniref:Uncharacterized protein n=1 Tax=Phlebia brevispora TaxID=194682 RepID=A0ACC1TA10_9APHY|nr:hypothetical protein NM688_g2178 [Phlebia brevispora]
MSPGSIRAEFMGHDHEPVLKVVSIHSLIEGNRSKEFREDIYLLLRAASISSTGNSIKRSVLTSCLTTSTMDSPPSNSSAPVPTTSPPRLTFDDTLGVIYISALRSKYHRRDILRFDDYSDLYLHAQKQEGPEAVPDYCGLLDTAHLALICSFVYHYTVTNFANPLSLLVAPPTLGIHVVIAGLSDALVRRSRFSPSQWRKYFPDCSYRILDVLVTSWESRNHVPAMAAMAIKLKYISHYVRIRWLVYCTFISGATIDVLIASSLCFLLLRRRTGFSRTDSTINTLMIYAINTGAFTSCVSIVAVIAFATMPNNLVYLGLLIVLPKRQYAPESNVVYSIQLLEFSAVLLNSLLANLNARPALKGHDTGDLVSIHLSDFATTNPSHPRGTSGHESSSSQDEPVLGIKRVVETYQKVD